MGDVIDLGEQDQLSRSTVVQAVYDFLTDNMPKGDDDQPWEPAVGALDDLLINGFGQEVDELAHLLSTVSASAFRYLGLKVHKVLPLDPLPAGATTQWTNGTGIAQVVPNGTALSIGAVAFEVDGDVTVPAGGGPVPVLARDPGSAGNGLADPVTVRDNLSWTPPPVATLGTGIVTGGGADGEDDDTYLARLVDELQLLSRAAITTDDFARIAQRVEGVHRVLVLPRYDPGAPGAVTPGHVTLVAQGDDGGPVDHASLLALFADGGRAIVPIQVHVADPAPHDVSVVVTVSTWPAFTAAAVAAQVQELIAEFLDPASWGAPRTGDGDLGWIDDPEVSALALAGAIERGDTVRRVESINISGTGERLDFSLGAGVGLVPHLAGTPAVTVVGAST